MKVLFDLNVLLDVMQRREQFYTASAAALSRSLEGECEGVIPGHAVTTLHYLLTRYADKQKADGSIDFLLGNFAVVNADAEDFRYARQLAMNDFEDAVVAAIAVKAKCDVIVTRNISDFKISPVQALLPEEFMES
uniref:Pilus assembly protein n=1 Tax=uncultured Thiotrichaceae bacterium TaxID=298394 RepID=A0A6S6U5I6_9GAMM|nr:MAG: Pilus assembly protein [uncultured Thiotrichaceae bacterium]